MKNFFTFLFMLFSLSYISAQCLPAPQLDCDANNILCSAKELEGMSCSTLNYSNPTGPSPLCSGAGSSENTQWWAFWAGSEPITIQISVDVANSSNGKGIEAGLVSYCEYNIDCSDNPTATSITLHATPNKQCKVYYLWVDGVDGNVCNFTITSVTAQSGKLPSPIKFEIYEENECDVIVCNDLEITGCYGGHVNTQWTENGHPLKEPVYEFCNTIKRPIAGEIKEVCFTISLDGPDATPCDEFTSCVNILGHPGSIVHEGNIYACWEDHLGKGYLWRDSLIYDDCIDPPCTVYRNENNGCVKKYIANIKLKGAPSSPTVNRFLCSPDMLPILTEDSKDITSSVCDREVSFQDALTQCDTTYYINVEVFDPSVAIDFNCAGCSDTNFIQAKVNYDPECNLGTTNWGYTWLNQDQDTLGTGNMLPIDPSHADSISLHLNVIHKDLATGKTTSCSVSNPKWNFNFTPLTIKGDSAICSGDTVLFTLPAIYHSCDWAWSLEGLNGNLSTKPFNASDSVVVIWGDVANQTGKICIQHDIAGCSNPQKTCFELVGCISTATNLPNPQAWSAHPNPAGDYLYIEGVNPMKTTVRLFDMNNKHIDVSMEKYKENTLQMDVHALTSGAYLLLIQEGKETAIIKTIIRH